MKDVKLSVQPYKGTRDFYPEDMRLRNWFFGVIRDQLEQAAFEEYNGPILESLELYAAKSGVEIANEQTYHFLDRGGRELAVRPEMTPTVARLVAKRINELNFPLKWFSIPNLYRYERPQRGRLREHWQVNVDIFGCDTYEADFEIIHTASRLMRALGADASMYRIHINNRRFFNDILNDIGGGKFDNVALSKIIDRKNKVTEEAYLGELREFGLNDEQIGRLGQMYGLSVEEAAALLPDSTGAGELRELFAALNALGLGDICLFDFSIIRGLDYYTGTVFEVFDLDPENNRAMFGGGRYDNLVGLFDVKNEVSGVGFGFGDVTLENFLRSHNLIPDLAAEGCRVLITRFPEVPFEKYQALRNSLYDSGVTASVYLGQKKLAKQIDYAVKGGFTHIVVMGESEVAAGTVMLRRLSDRSEITCPAEELAAQLRG